MSLFAGVCVARNGEGCLRKREEAEGTNLFVCEGPHSEELLPGVKMN